MSEGGNAAKLFNVKAIPHLALRGRQCILFGDARKSTPR